MHYIDTLNKDFIRLSASDEGVADPDDVIKRLTRLLDEAIADLAAVKTKIVGGPQDPGSGENRIDPPQQ